MKKLTSISLAVLTAASLLFAACGSSGGGDGSGLLLMLMSKVTVTADKSIALANGDSGTPEVVLLTATVVNGLGQPQAGKAVTFGISAGLGTLFEADASTNASGVATVKLRRDPIAPAPPTYEDVTVQASVDRGSGSRSVRFINTPTTATVQVALTSPVTGLAVLTFDVIDTPKQALPIVEPINEADTLPFIGHPDVNQNTFASLLAADYTYTLITDQVPALAPAGGSAIVRLTYTLDPAMTALPTFAMGTNAAHVNAFGPLPASAPLVPALTPANFALSVKFDTEP